MRAILILLESEEYTDTRDEMRLIRWRSTTGLGVEGRVSNVRGSSVRRTLSVFLILDLQPHCPHAFIHILNSTGTL